MMPVAPPAASAMLYLTYEELKHNNDPDGIRNDLPLLYLTYEELKLAAACFSAIKKFVILLYLTYEELKQVLLNRSRLSY